MNRFLGDSPARTIVKLIVMSFLVGLVMSFFEWTPMDVWYWAEDVVLRIWYSGFETFGRFVGYMLLGAAIVVPIFLVMRLVKYRG